MKLMGSKSLVSQFKLFMDIFLVQSLPSGYLKIWEDYFQMFIHKK